MKVKLVTGGHGGKNITSKVVHEELVIEPGNQSSFSGNGTAATLNRNKGKSGFVRRGKALVFLTSGNEALRRKQVNAALKEDREKDLLPKALRQHNS